MKFEHDPQVTNSRDFHALHAHLSLAIPAAEELCTRYPDDRAMQRLCIHLYDALELMLREPPDQEEFIQSGLLAVGQSSAA